MPDQQEITAWALKMEQVLTGVTGSLPPGPSAPAAGENANDAGNVATAASAGPRTVPGAGGYEYEQHADGAIYIVKSPKSGQTRIQVEFGSTAYNAILAEIGPFGGGGAGPSIPETPADSPDYVTPPTAGDPTGPGENGSPIGDGEELPDGVAASLESLMAKEQLTADEIAEARRLIAQEPESSQGALYEQLQVKTAYSNQRNNDTSLETADGGTCALTAVSMALSYLGVKNPYPEMDFDEALVKIATDDNLGDIKGVDCWTKVAAKLGVNNVEVFASSVKKNRSWWESTVDDGYLRKGYGVVMSLDGHVVRLEGVADAGLVVDDPYGASKLSGRTFDDNDDGVADRPKYSFVDSNDADGADGSNSGNAGEDTGYPWADVEKYTFKYLVAFK